MNKVISNILFGRGNAISGMIAFGVVALIALGCTCGKNLDLSNTGSSSSNSSSNTPFSTSNGDVPSKTEMQSMLKDTANIFAGAIDTGDFTEFYNAASTDFQNTYTKDQVKDGFKTYLDRKSAILPSLKRIQSTDAVFSSEPHIRTEQGLSILVMEGKWPTKPFEIKFDAEYVQRGGQWKMLIWKLTVG